MRIVLLLLAALLSIPALAGSAQPGSAAIHIGGHAIEAELATTPASREHGLMFRMQMNANQGMLFIFPDETPRWFWMKNTLIPLDIIYIGSNRQVVSIRRNLPPCRSKHCPSYASDKPARYVLELNGGAAQRLDIEVGDTLVLPDRPLAVH